MGTFALILKFTGLLYLESGENMAEWDKKRKIMLSYDQSSAAYDNQYREEQEAKMNIVLKNIGKNRFSLAIDDGCGTGLAFMHLLKIADSVVGVDFSSKLLRKAKERAKRLQDVQIVRADADHLPFTRETFDVALTMTVLQNTPNPIETLSEVKRVSKQNSTIIVTGLKKQFPLDKFETLLNQVGLKISTINTENEPKDYVAICRIF